MRYILVVLLAAPLLRPLAATAATRTVLHEIWRVELAAAGPPPVFARPLEALVDDGTGNLLRIDATSGVRLGVARLPNPTRQILASRAGAHVVTVADELLLLDADGAIVTARCLPAPALHAAVGEHHIVVPLDDATLAAFDLFGHGLAWRVPVAAAASAAPAVADDIVATPLQNGRLSLVRAADGGDVAEVQTGVAAAVTPARLGDGFVVSWSDGRVAAVRAANGKPKWKAEVGRGASAEIVAAGARALVATTANQLLALKDNGTPAWRASLAGRVRDPPVLWERSVLVVPYRRSELQGFDLETGQSSVRAALAEPLGSYTSGAVVSESIVLLLARDGNRRLLIGYSEGGSETVRGDRAPSRRGQRARSDKKR